MDRLASFVLCGVRNDQYAGEDMSGNEDHQYGFYADIKKVHLRPPLFLNQEYAEFGIAAPPYDGKLYVYISFMSMAFQT